MTFEAFTQQVNAAATTVELLSTGALKRLPETNYTIDVCECVAELTGADATLCKMLNRDFREAAAKVMLERTHEMVNAA